MSSPPTQDVTRLLRRWRAGEAEALERLVPLVYDELRRLARRSLRGEREGHTLEATGLVHEAFLRLVDGAGGLPWQDRAHFFGVAARLMRQILVDHARARGAAKRGGGAVKVPLDEAREPAAEPAADVLALDDALEALQEIDPRKSRIVELRFFGGLSLEETAEVMGISVPLVVRETRLARAWLFHRIAEGHGR